MHGSEDRHFSAVLGPNAIGPLSRAKLTWHVRAHRGTDGGREADRPSFCWRSAAALAITKIMLMPVIEAITERAFCIHEELMRPSACAGCSAA